MTGNLGRMHDEAGLLIRELEQSRLMLFELPESLDAYLTELRD